MRMLFDFYWEEVMDSQKYAKCAIKHKEDNPQLASTFYELSKEEYNHADRIKICIDKHMTDEWKHVWEYEYEKLTEFLTEIRCMWDLFKS